MTTKPIIPAAVLALLSTQWKEADPGGSVFDLVFSDRPNSAERRRAPKLYRIHPRKRAETAFDTLSHVEALRLVAEGVFASLARVEGDTVVVNEHAMHALEGFCEETYSAWQKYQRRLAEVEKVSPSLS